MAFLLSYTRKPIDEVHYDKRLAYSMHLAISADGKVFTPLNHNSGVLFPKATENEDGTLNPKCLRHPRIYKDGDVYKVVAVRADGEGGEDKSCLFTDSFGDFATKVIVFETTDFINYKELGLFEADALQTKLLLTPYIGTADLKKIEGVVPEHIVEIPDDFADRLTKKLSTPENVSVELPCSIKVSSEEEILNYKVTFNYSDGTSSKKVVDWDLSNVDFTKSGSYEIKGHIKQPHFDFPVAFDRADPCVGFYNGKFYFIATNDADGNHTLYIRESDTIEGLVNAEEHLILDSTTYEGIGGLLWAPEFHIINGRLYIFHACTPEPFFEEESHVMELKEGGNPINKDDWSRPKRVVKADGSDICEAGKEITLDMTEFEWQGDYYVIWSQRQFLPVDLGAWLYVAKLNPEKPWMLLSEPVVLSKPDYGWGNNHTFVEEGPFALIRDDKLYVTFSAAAVDTSYVVGLLSIEKGKDLLDPSSWQKKGYPILTSRSVEGEFGTGHNAYVTDAEGNIWNTYHARPGEEAPRSSGIRRVHFDMDGEPVLDLTEDKDIKEEFRTLQTKLIVEIPA
ncbi:MAG: family 43 glycosylhydrolase [Lachnospiraceae bacterium]|nr:family 43 glycosylhydrolase [Lachnospiraceae bacterium]